MENVTPQFKVKLELVGLDGNAFNILGKFRQACQRQRIEQDKIEQLLKDAMSGDYNHLLCVISDHCESEDTENEEDQWNDSNSYDSDEEEE